MMAAHRSASTKVFGTSGLVEAAVGADAPPSFEGGCSLDSGATLVSGMMSGWGPDCSGPPPSVAMGVSPSMSSAAKVLSSGAFSVASLAPPWPGEVLRDNTSVLSTVIGEGARGGVSLSASSGGRELPSDNDGWGRSRAGLKDTRCNMLYYKNMKDRRQLIDPL